MIMPLKQNCHKCGETFIGSDAIGDLCPRCKLEKSGMNTVTCPTCRGCGYVVDKDEFWRDLDLSDIDAELVGVFGEN